MKEIRKFRLVILYGLFVLLLAACSSNSSNLDASANYWMFTDSPNNNDYWLEVTITPPSGSGHSVSKAAVVYDGAEPKEMTKTEWGSYALNEKVDKSKSYVYRAWDEDGETHDSKRRNEQATPTEPTDPEPKPDSEPKPDPEPTPPAEPAPTEPAPTEPAPPVTGTLIDVLDAETGDFSQWRNAEGGGSGNHTIVTNPVAQGKYAFKWTYDGRTESASDYYPANQDIWISWKLWLPKDFNDSFVGDNDSQGLSVSQLAGYSRCGDDQPPIAMLRVKEGQFFWWLRDWESVNGVYDNLGAVPKEQWIDLLINFKVTTNNDGYFRFWLNGEQKLEVKGANWPCNTEGPYFKAGTYAFGYENGDYILGDDIRVGTTRESVEQ
ncbi:MAG: heparin lyase I family protein [Trueperaceae bacterium]